MMMNVRASMVLLLAAALTAGCSTKKGLELGDKSVADYKAQKGAGATPLEVPPGLSAQSVQDTLVVPNTPVKASEVQKAGSTTAPATAGTQAAVLPVVPGIHVEREGDVRWLVADASADALWPKIRQFWIDTGFLLRHDDPSAGVMETDWSENRADIPRDVITDFVRKHLDFVYAAPTRDRFRVRIERGLRSDTTEIYLSHFGMEQVVQATSDPASNQQVRWRPRPADPGLESEMLARLMVYLGTGEAPARQAIAKAHEPVARARLVQDDGGAAALLLDGPADRNWRLTGVALDRIGFVVEERDSTALFYRVRYDDPFAESGKEGLWSKMAFWRDEPPEADHYRVHVAAEGEQRTRIVVENAQGQRDTSRTAKRILQLLYEQLR